MKCFGYLMAALTVAMALGGGQALANVCQAENLICPTTMPVDGYCECSAHGVTKDGTVVPKAPPQGHVNARSGGCGAQPNQPGCR
jgi:hypothetical protein